MHFTCRSFIGKPDDQSWSQYWENEPDDPILVSQKGHLFGLLALTNPQSLEDISGAGHDIIDEFSRLYYSKNDEDIASALKSTVLEITSNPLYSQYHATFALAVTSGSRLFLATWGLSHIALSRSGKVGIMVSGKSEEVTVVSGLVRAEDKLFLVTHEFLSSIGWDKTKNTLSESKIQNIEENFLSYLYHVDNQKNLAAVLVQIHLDNEPDPPQDLTLEEKRIDTPQDESQQINLPIPSPEEVVAPTVIKNEPPPAGNLYSRLFKQKSVYISHHDTVTLDRRKKINIALALFLLMGLSLSSYFGYQKNQSAKIEKNYQELKKELETKISSARSLKTLNLDDAQKVAKEAKEISEKLISLNIHTQETSSYVSEIDALLTSTGSSESFSPQLFFDTTLIGSDFSYSVMTSAGDKLVLYDPSIGRADDLSTTNKNHRKLIASDKAKNYNLIVANNDKFYLSDYKEIALIENGAIDIKFTLDSEDFDEFKDLAAWNGAFYLLDSNANRIWKLSPTATGFGKPVSWLKDETLTPPGPNSLAINGKIWVINPQGQLTPYDRGLKSEFKYSSQNTFKEVANLATLANDDVLSFTDGNILYAFKKDGSTLGKFNFGDKKILDISLVSPDLVYVLCSDKKIYVVELSSST